jgi:hypothetical protein
VKSDSPKSIVISDPILTEPCISPVIVKFFDAVLHFKTNPVSVKIIGVGDFIVDLKEDLLLITPFKEEESALQAELRSAAVLMVVSVPEFLLMMRVLEELQLRIYFGMR